MARSVRTIDIAIFLGSAALLVAVLVLRSREPTPATLPAQPRLTPLGAIPNGPTFLATVDLARVRQSPLGATLTESGRVLPGVGRLSDVCGFDPTSELDELAFAIPKRDSTDFGLVGTGHFAAKQMAECASAIVAKRHGKPGLTQVGSFVTVRDLNGSAGEIAVRDGGPVMLGDGHYLRDMIDTAEGRLDNVSRDKTHESLRASVGDGALVASWVVPPGWLERVTDSNLVRLSPLSSLRAAALRVNVAPKVSALAVLGCSSEAACADLAGVLDSLRKDLAPLIRRELGDDPFAAAKISVAGRVVRVEMELAPTRAAAILLRLMQR
ncbi:MAG: hypothetical protein KC776_01340 [Myxococcales bacterium]|nr:hypothetical protein [Myxococcales bacterium]MCB9583258.1 hypothetical protein [Polyangiaceae bacterium]